MDLVHTYTITITCTIWLANVYNPNVLCNRVLVVKALQTMQKHHLNDTSLSHKAAQSLLSFKRVFFHYKTHVLTPGHLSTAIETGFQK